MKKYSLRGVLLINILIISLLVVGCTESKDVNKDNLQGGNLSEKNNTNELKDKETSKENKSNEANEKQDAKKNDTKNPKLAENLQDVIDDSTLSFTRSYPCH